MSAIFGILRFDGSAVAPRDLERMAAALVARSPDGHRVLADGPVGLGHGLMRVTHEDRFDAQPLRDVPAGLTLVADVRLDNREELAESFGLTARELATTPDSALVLRAYARWGDDCAERLLGDFAFAIWDARSRKLVLARDHMGQRYVHYYLGEHAFVFATEINALWSHADVPRALSDEGIGRLVMPQRFVEPGVTLFEGIRGVPGGCVTTVDAAGATSTRRYWEPRADPAHEGRDEAYYVDAYRRVLGEAVECRVRRTLANPGLVFSGGYDSAAIAGLAGPALSRRGQKLIASSSVMPADYRGTIRHARRWVEMCARDMPYLDVHYVTREGKSVLSDLERSFLETGAPAGTYGFITRELFSSIARRGARVVMDGHGGDYTLHPRGQAALARFLATGQLRRFLRELRSHRRMTSDRIASTLLDVTRLVLPEPLFSTIHRIRHRGTPPWGDRAVNADFARRALAHAGEAGRLRGARPRPSLDMRDSMLATLLDVARAPAGSLPVAAASVGLELTRPFHDKRVVELALAVPQDLYVKNGRNRYLACVALRDVYPPEYQNRWRKNDDEIPDFQRMVKAIEPQLLDEIARMERSSELPRYFDFAKIRSLLAARGAEDHNSGWEQETQLAMLGFTAARYVEWFRGKNR